MIRKAVGQGELKAQDEMSQPDNMSSSQEGKRLSLPHSRDGVSYSNKNMIKLLPPLDSLDELDGEKIKYDLFKKQ